MFVVSVSVGVYVPLKMFPSVDTGDVTFVLDVWRYPPVIATLFAFCVDIVPSPRFVLAELADVAPVPPFATARVPAIVIVPDVVIGPPLVVRPVVPPDTATDVTVPPPPLVAAMVIESDVAFVVRVMPEPATRVSVSVVVSATTFD
jgi:hypothetical protein